MPDEVANPLSLVNRFAAEGGRAEEILVCTYEQNLAFFERCALGASRATGARVTLIGDLDVIEHDLAAIHHAGVSYLAAGAKARGAFHPKLIVLANADRATVAIGSGNLTLAGWFGNDELWTILHGTAETGASPALAEVAAWLDQLPSAVTLSADAIAALDRTSTLLSRFESSPMPDGPSASVRVVHGLTTPIIEHLPTGPVDELGIYAPFHDHSGEAVRRLVERLRPAEVRLGIQPGLTSAKGEALADVLPTSTEIVELDPSPYRHGKLVEWRVGDRWEALTGSANLSGPALCDTAVSGGNIELGVIAPTDGPLLPAGTTATMEDLRRLKPTGPVKKHRREVVLILAVTRTDVGVRIDFVRPLRQDATLQRALPDTPPGSWDLELPVAEATETVVVEDAPGGTRFRATLADGTPTRAEFVMDPASVLRRVGSASSQQSLLSLEDLFSDVDAARRLFRVLEDLPSPSRSTVTPPAAPGDHESGANQDSEPYTVGDWRDYLALAEEVVSPDVLAFALGLPPSGTAASSPTHAPRNWDEDDPDDVAGGLEDDIAEEVTADGDLGGSGVITESITWGLAAEARERYWKSLLPGERTQPIAAMARVRMMLLFVAAGGCSQSDKEWVKPTLRAIEQLAVTPLPEDQWASAGGLIAVGLAAIRSSLSTVQTTTRHSALRRAEQQASHLLVASDDEKVSEFGRGLTKRFGATIAPLAVAEEVERIVNNDPLRNALADLRLAGTSVATDDGVLCLTGDVDDARQAVLHALSRCRDLREVCIRAGSEAGGWATAVWHDPDLLILLPAEGLGSWGAVYQLVGGDVTVLSGGDIQAISEHEVERFSAKQEPGQAAAALLENAGLDRLGAPVNS